MKNIGKTIKENYGLVTMAVIFGIFLGWLFFNSGHKNDSGENIAGSHTDHDEDQHTIWTCSMHPQIKQDKPGKCPICGMDLIPLESMSGSSESINPDEIMFSEAAAKLAEIQTSIVKKGNPEKLVYLQGKVEADERNVAELTARFGGRIEKLYVNFTGETVRKGDKLASIYSPELVTAQKELIEAMAFRETRPAIYKAAKAKLKLWDLNDEQISAIEEKAEPTIYFDILSPISGTVMQRNVALGDYVKMGDPLFRITDLSDVWVMFDAYEDDLAWIKRGDRIEYTIRSVPGKAFTGKISFIDPVIDPVTRSARLRVETGNPGLMLKPEMFASGTIHSVISGKNNRLMIPRSAILWTGKRAVVYVKVPDRESPSFLYREIELGPEAGNFYVVAGGLKEGEEIATNGVFRIDAAAQLEGKQSMMNPTGMTMTSMHDHGNMEMSGNMQGKTDTGKQDEMTGVSVPESFKKQLTAVYQSYIPMKDAFVASDPGSISSNAEKLMSELKKVDMSLLKGDLMKEWMTDFDVLKKTLAAIQGSSDLELQRKEFSGFNLGFYKVIKSFGLSGVETYYQYCPMANRDQGAYWFSDEEEIRNPYFGDEMLSCGETREKIK